MAKIFPTFENIERLKVQPTEGELHLLEYLEKNLPDEVEVYFQPFLNGDMPDIILMQKDLGVTIIEVKDWNLSSYSVDYNNKWHFKNGKGNIKSPFQQVYTYKDNLFNLHINGLLEQKIKHKEFYGRINTYVYFHKANKQELNDLQGKALKKLREEQQNISTLIQEKKLSPDKANKRLTYISYKKKKIDRDFHYNAVANDMLEKIKLPNERHKKLFTHSIYQEFKRYLNPPSHVLNQGKEIIYTDQQKKLIMSKPEKIKIKGVAGSGKTNVLAKRAVNALKRHGERVLILTYNITLVRLIHDKISDVRDDFQWNKFHMINYHEFFKQNANQLGIEITIPDNVKDVFNTWSDKQKEEFFESNYYSKRNLFSLFHDETKRYKTILIDEIQDYNTNWVKILRDYFLEPDGELVLFGDEKQNIYHREFGHEQKFKTVHGFGRWIKLTKPIRQMGGGDRIVDLSIKFQKAFFSGRYEIDDDIDNPKQLKLDQGIFQVVPYHGLNGNEYENIVSIIYHTVKKQNIHPNDICVLGSQIDPMVELDYLIRKKFNEKTITTFETKEIRELENFEIEKKNIRTIKKFAFNANNGMMKLSTIHSFKGYEAPTVFLVLLGNDSPELVYAALTRSKFNLMIFAPNQSSYYDFFSALMYKHEAKKKEEDIYETINYCIKERKELEVEYHHLDKIDILSNLKPYKILFLNENFYLACETNTQYKFAMLRLSRIHNANSSSTSFERNIEIDDFIAHIQTPFSRYSENYRENLIEIIIEVDKKKSKFFTEKKFLASQEIVQEKDNGNLIIKYIVTQESEVEELIKKWIPYLRVIEPSTLDEKIKNDLEKYLYS